MFRPVVAIIVTLFIIHESNCRNLNGEQVEPKNEANADVRNARARPDYCSDPKPTDEDEAAFWEDTCGEEVTTTAKPKFDCTKPRPTDSNNIGAIMDWDYYCDGTNDEGDGNDTSGSSRSSESSDSSS